ncbi:recombinase family protein [Thermobrachium celere]|uniref:Phage integrase (Site-specific recombinase) n=1 Tax=Thermobrachium celere DSM 8682 TaxID=941824 RepID=R7RRG9_9CLOT|nr:recombinase family protein [Thermobrachium celere]CDF58639.1 Phage integrase (Site-specific recombinase) [Thermobrachium celere DSM 8682]
MTPSTVLSILQNEKYKGDAILQKTLTLDFLTKKRKKNEGEVPQYYVENSHPPIIPPELFDLVQTEIKKRKEVKGYKTGGSCFSGKIVCGECGSFYGRKVWHSNSKYRRVIWQCNSKFKNDKKCTTPHLYEDKIKKAFVEVFNSLINNKEEILKGYEDIIQSLTDTTKLDMESVKLQSELEIVTEIIRKCVEENAHKALNQEDYNEKYDAPVERHESFKEELERIEEKRLEQTAKKEKILEFIKELESREGLVTEFDEELWIGVVDRVVVKREGKISFVFKDGMEVEWDI